jgi:Cu(I)/Ag(I) efflux system membrane fusion protein
MMINRNKFIAIIIVALAAGVGLALLAKTLLSGPKHGATHPAEAPAGHSGHDEAEDSGSYYTCPMHPSVVSETPGACPVCHMDLIKKSATSEGMDPQELAAMGRVAISPTERVLANVETVAARAVGSATSGSTPSGSANDEAGKSATEIRAVGVVAFDESGLAAVPSWLDGRIERLLIEETGAEISRGEPIMEIYSPELLTAQKEFLIALDNAQSSLIEPTRQRLLLLGMSENQVERLEETREARRTVTMHSPNAGTVTELLVRQGQYVKTGTPLYKIADLSEVWIEAEVRAPALSQIAVGAPARVTSDALGGKSLSGEVTFIYPTLQTDTRTVKVRVELDEPTEQLKPGVFVSVFLRKNADAKPAESTSESTDDVPVDVIVPRSAVIRGGKSSSVYVEVSQNIFERREVEIGRATEDFLIIAEGLKPGEIVASGGVFLLDSEVQLNSFGQSAHVHHGSKASPNERAGHAEHAEIEPADIPQGGKKFDPPVPVDTVSDTMWICDMGGKTHWVQHEKGDGTCPICGMHLTQHREENRASTAASDSEEAK